MEIEQFFQFYLQFAPDTEKCELNKTMKQDSFDEIWIRVKSITGWMRQNDLANFLGVKSTGISEAKGKGLFRDKWAKKIAEKYNTTAYYILYGEKAKAEPHSSQQPVSEPTNYDNFRISEKLQKTAEILESDTLYRPALAANIDAFHHGMTQEKVVQDQQVQIAANKKQITDLEARMAVLENYLACATVTPDNYKLHKGTNENGAA